MPTVPPPIESDAPTGADAVAATLARIAAAPRSQLAAAVAAEVGALVGARPLVLVTPHCPRAPVKWHGAWPQPALRDDEVHALASGAPPGASTVPLPGGTHSLLLVRASSWGSDPSGARPTSRPSTVSAEPSTLGLLVATDEVIPAGGLPSGWLSSDGLSSDGLRVVGEVWAVLAVLLADRDRVSPGDGADAVASSNVAAADEVRRVSSASVQAHAADLTDVLAALRAGRSSDRAARARATEVASRALVGLRSAPRADAGLNAARLVDLHGRIAPEVSSSLRSHRMTGGLATPVDDALLNREVATVVELLTRAVVGAVIEARARVDGAGARSDRLSVEWRPDGAAVVVTVRTDAPGDADLAHLDRYVSSVGGRLDDRRDPVWGRELVATVPTVSGAPRRSAALSALTDREVETLARLEAGASNRMIATDWGVSEATVKFHVRNVMLKLGARSRSEAVALARRS